MVAFLLLVPAVVIFLALFVFPIIYLGAQSFRVRVSMFSGELSGLTLRNYTILLTDPFYLGMIFTTFKLATLCAAICLVFAYPVALFLRLVPNRYKGLVLVGVLSPLLISVVVRTFGWVVILGEFGLINALLRSLGMDWGFSTQTHLYNEGAVLIGLVHVFFPFMVLAVYNSLQKLDWNVVRAARSLGASPARALFHVILPLSVPGIISGVATVLALAAGAYVTVAVLGGARVPVLAVLAYQQSIGLMNWQFGAAIGVLLLMVTTGLLALLYRGAGRMVPGVRV
jgi:putative spermidine/putrescine transport system permease protein